MPLSDDLIAYWKLDEESGTRVDSHANNDLTDTNTVLYGTGKVGNAAHFDDANSECLQIADNADLSFGDEAFSIAGWINLDDNTATQVVLSKYDPTNNDREYQIVYITGTGLRFDVSSDGTDGNTTTVTETTVGAFDAATWYFFLCVHDPADAIYISVNNNTADSAAHSNGCNDNISAFAIGAQIDNGSPAWELDGLMDEVGIWGKLVSNDERAALYNSGNGVTYPLPTSVAGNFVSTGTVTKKTSDSHDGVFVSTGTVAKKTKRALDGASTFIGAVVGKAKKALAGTITFSGTSVLMKLRVFFARFHDYFFTAPQKFTISSNAVDMTARYRDYNFTAPKREGYG